MESLPLEWSEVPARVSMLPLKAGVYIWLTEDGRVLYVGATQNLRTRHWTHGIEYLKALKVATIKYTLIPLNCWQISNRLEESLIKELKPLLNIRTGCTRQRIGPRVPNGRKVIASW